MIYCAKKIDTPLNYTVVESREDVPDLWSYWTKRNTYFRNFDDGYLLDDEGLYSITPYKSAEEIAERYQHCEVIVDAFCGCAGNSIAFARICTSIKKVYAIDLNKERLEIAKHNAKLAGYDHIIEFIHGDALKLVHTLKNVDAIFGSPAWNIKLYRQVSVYRLKDTTPNSNSILSVFKQSCPNFSLMLPSHTLVEDLMEFNEIFEIKHYYSKSKNKVSFVCVYWGNLINEIN